MKTSIDLSGFSILTSDMETALTDLQNSGLDDIDFAEINSTVSSLSPYFSTIQLISYICITPECVCTPPLNVRFLGMLIYIYQINVKFLINSFIILYININQVEKGNVRKNMFVHISYFEIKIFSRAICYWPLTYILYMQCKL